MPMTRNGSLTNKYADANSIARLWQRIKGTFVRKDGNKVLSDNNFSNEDKAKLAILEPLSVASQNTLGGIKVGSGLAINQNGVMSVESAGEVQWADVQNTPVTIAGYGITDAATKTELNEVKEKVSRVIRIKGHVNTIIQLEAIQNPEDGDMYDVLENGHNYVWLEDEARWDDFGETFHIDSLTPEEIDVITGFATNELIFEQILENGGYIELGNDLTFSSQKIISQDVVLDLNGYDIDSSIAKAEKKELFVVDGVRLIIKGDGKISNADKIAKAINGGEIYIENGSFETEDIGFIAIGIDSSIVFNDGNLLSVNGAIGALDGASVEVNGGTLESSDSYVLFGSGKNDYGGSTIVLNGGLLIGNSETVGYESVGIYIANNDTFVMNGGEIRANNGAGLCMRAGSVTINNGRIIATGEPGTTGKIADSSILMSKSAVIYHESADYPGKTGMSLTINGGTFIGVDHSVEVLSNEAEPAVTITDGDFTPAYQEV